MANHASNNVKTSVIVFDEGHHERACMISNVGPMNPVKVIADAAKEPEATERSQQI